nr:hypothetical protein GCM10020093_047970 [Planobispora longispora]
MPGEEQDTGRWRRRLTVLSAAIAAIAAVLADKADDPLHWVPLTVVTGIGAVTAAWCTLAPRRRADAGGSAEASETAVPEGERGHAARALPAPLGPRHGGDGPRARGPRRARPAARQPTFRGREAELDALLDSYRAQRRQRTPAPVRGPVVLALHGPPGWARAPCSSNWPGGWSRTTPTGCSSPTSVRRPGAGPRTTSCTAC